MMSMMMATPTAKKHNIDNHHEDHKDKDDKGKHHNDKPTMTKMYQCYYPKIPHTGDKASLDRYG